MQPPGLADVAGRGEAAVENRELASSALSEISDPSFSELRLRKPALIVDTATVDS
jgi:hypothetical protein